MEDDITANKHGGNAESAAANKKVLKERDRARVVQYFHDHGEAHSKEVARALGKPLNALSGRFSELLRAGIIERTGRRAEGCAVLRLERPKEGFPLTPPVCQDPTEDRT